MWLKALLAKVEIQVCASLSAASAHPLMLHVSWAWTCQMVPSPWWATSTSVWIKTACNRIRHRHHNISLLLMFVNRIQENPLEVMRHFLHNTTLTWRLFSPTWFSLITTAHRILFLNFKSAVLFNHVLVQPLMRYIREEEELLKNNQHEPHPRLLTGQDSMTGARSGFWPALSQSVCHEDAECSWTIAEKGPHLARAPGEPQSSSTNTPPLQDRMWPPRSAAGRGNNVACALSAIKTWVIRLDNAAQ